MKNYRSKVRYSIIIIIFAVFLTIFVGRLFSLQVANKYNYSIEEETIQKRYVNIKALRGKIYDRNGVLLVSNKVSYNIQINKYGVSNSMLPDTIFRLMNLLKENGIEITDRFAVTKTQPFEFENNYFETKSNLFNKFANDNISIENYSATELMDYLIEKYSLRNYSKNDARIIIGQLFEMHIANFGYGIPYEIVSEISAEEIVKVADKLMLINGVEISYTAERNILHGNFAAHILGTVGKIYEEDYAKYSAEGYPMDAIVGRSGVEKAFEQYLRAYDGVIVQEVDQNNCIINAYYEKKPIAGKDVYLTIDYNVQLSAQEALDYTVKTYSPENGAGAIVVQNPHTAEILAIASNPTYNLDEYYSNYSEIASSPNSPLINRALNGLYAPGSTFKVLTCIAALENNIIEPYTTIFDKGIYDKYAPSYAPRCWVYNKYKRGHGSLDVTGALQKSCNYFFFDVGDKLGITMLNEYSKKFGLGQLTGIEIGESSGILAGPEERSLKEQEWYKGDTLQAAIGQSDNLFTPIQLSSFMCTFLNGGTRYQSHLLQSVRNYHDNSIYYQMPANILSHTEISDSTYNVVKSAMKRVVEDGTAATIFNNTTVPIGGKTGSAETGKGNANGVFIGFAPYDDPELCVTVVIEHGSKGANAAVAAKMILEDYFEKQED